MKTILKFNSKNSFVLPMEFRDDDVRFSDSFAEYFIERYSKPNNMVFDPFAGFGTTLYAAEKLGRKAYGIEYLSERAEYIKQNIENNAVILHENSLNLEEINLPEIDFILTSPPYMSKSNHPQYPFARYKITGQGYNDYLNDIANIFCHLKSKMKSDAFAVIEVSNLIIDGEFTPLAWDVAKSIADVLTLEHEFVIEWQGDSSPTYGFGYDHSYALVFRNNCL